jgi:type IV secretory pathway VirB10-like protein
VEQIAMKDEFTTKVVEPNAPGAAVLDEAPDEKLATQALEDIRKTEQLSGFGRFATKMQNFFQASKSSQTKQQSSHLKAAPVMMSVGLLLLVTTGMLFLLSKPESADHSHFRSATGLSGADDRKPITSSNTDSAVTENQLAGSDTGADTQAANRVRSTRRGREDATARRPFGDGDGNTNPSVSPNPVATSELQNPATVFVANPISSSIINRSSNFHDAGESGVQLPSGTEITAHTTNAISSGLESPVIGIVDRNVQLGDVVVIPQGTRVIGYTGGAVKDRINVRFTSLILPNNREVTISGLALMKDGSAGLIGKVQGSGHSVLSGAARVGTGAAVVATEFAGQGSLNQPFSQADYVRNQLAYEVASEGSRYSNRLQQPANVPIVTVNTNQSIQIFLLNALTVSHGQIANTKPAEQTDTATTLNTGQNQPPEQALAATQTAYIQALEAQLVDMRSALNARKSNGSN